MVKQQKVPATAAGIPVAAAGKLRKCKRRKRPPRTQALRMLSQKQSEAEPGAEASGCKNNGDGASPGASCSSGCPDEAGGELFYNVVKGADGSTAFLSTGRTGRRNAMPFILGEHADTGTADLPEKLEALTTDPAGPSGARSQAEPGTSQQQQQQQQQHTG